MKNDDNIVVEVETESGILVVKRLEGNKYDVIMDNVVRHPKCDPESAMRALGHYIQGFSYKAKKTNRV